MARVALAVATAVSASEMVHPTSATRMLWESTCCALLRLTSIQPSRSKSNLRFLTAEPPRWSYRCLPHLSDLQPSDEFVAFKYFSLALVVRGEVLPKGQPVNSIGFVELFGASGRAESAVVLRPGEWIRVSANVKLRMPPSETVSMRFHGDFWLRNNTFRPHAGGQFIEANNLYLNRTPTPFVPVRLLPHDGILQAIRLPAPDQRAIGDRRLGRRLVYRCHC
jgi:hypothetical protein